VLVLVSKLLQNLANGIRFGEKEQGMLRFNTFIDANKKMMTRLLQILYHHEHDDILLAHETEKEPRMDAHFIDSLIVLRDHLVHNNEFLRHYMKSLEHQKDGVVQLQVNRTLPSFLPPLPALFFRGPSSTRAQLKCDHLC